MTWNHNAMQWCCEAQFISVLVENKLFTPHLPLPRLLDHGDNVGAGAGDLPGGEGEGEHCGHPPGPEVGDGQVITSYYLCIYLMVGLCPPCTRSAGAGTGQCRVLLVPGPLLTVHCVHCLTSAHSAESNLQLNMGSLDNKDSQYSAGKVQD